MKDKKLDEELDGMSDSHLPEVSLIIVREHGKKSDKINIINLDHFSEDMHQKYYIDAVEKYGKQNVRYCKVLGTKVTVSVEFLD
jgi:hypothetical protein